MYTRKTGSTESRAHHKVLPVVRDIWHEKVSGVPSGAPYYSVLNGWIDFFMQSDNYKMKKKKARLKMCPISNLPKMLLFQLSENETLKLGLFIHFQSVFI